MYRWVMLSMQPCTMVLSYLNLNDQQMHSCTTGHSRVWGMAWAAMHVRQHIALSVHALH